MFSSSYAKPIILFEDNAGNLAEDDDDIMDLAESVIFPSRNIIS